MVYPSGISFPFRFSEAGGVARDEGAAKVVSNMKALVTTSQLERVIRKAIGTIAYKQVLRSGLETAPQVVENLIHEAIIRYVPAAVGLVVQLTSEEQLDNSKAWICNVSFIFKNTGDPVEFSVKL